MYKEYKEGALLKNRVFSRTEKPELWTKAALWRLVWPLVVEQILLVSVGMADTVMVTSVGEAAVSGVSLVDSINVLLVSVFAALATGGAVVVSQYLGRKDAKNASEAAKQLVYSIAAVSTGLMLIALLLRRPILQLVYGNIGPEVMENAEIYFLVTAVSYPFLAVYNAGAALFRSMGNSKVGMLTSLMVNIVNIGGNALLIFGLGWGAAGAAASTLASRIMAAALLVALLLRKGAGPASLAGLFHPKAAFDQVRRIFKIGVPSALENSTFQVGKLMVARIVSTFGISAIAGNAIAANLATLVNCAGMAIGMSLVTVVGQCVGAGDMEAAKHNTRRLIIAAHVSLLVMGTVMILLSGPILDLMGLSAEAIALAKQCIWLFCAFAGLFWPPSFALPNALRAAGDAKFTMVVSMISMWTFRIGCALLFAYTLGFGVLGVWMAMIVDWVVRAAAFMVRWGKGKWQNIRLLDQPDAHIDEQTTE